MIGPALPPRGPGSPRPSGGSGALVRGAEDEQAVEA